MAFAAAWMDTFAALPDLGQTRLRLLVRALGKLLMSPARYLYVTSPRANRPMRMHPPSVDADGDT